MLASEPTELAVGDSNLGAVDMHAHQSDFWGWVMIAGGAAGSWLAHNAYGLCSLGVMAAGLYVNWRNSEARLEKLRKQWEREWEASRSRDRTVS